MAKTVEDYKVEEFVDRDIEWIGEELPQSTNHITWWVCWVCDHEWEARYNDVARGSGCPNCSIRRLKTTQDYFDLAGEKNIIWLGGEVPKTVSDSTLWRCNVCSHEWTNAYKRIITKGGGRACPKCAMARRIETRKKTLLVKKRERELV